MPFIFTLLLLSLYEFWMMVTIPSGIPYCRRIAHSDGRCMQSKAFLKSMKFTITGFCHAAKVARRSGKDIWIWRPMHECCKMQDYDQWLLERQDCSEGWGCRNWSVRGFLLPGEPYIEQWKLWQRVQDKNWESTKCLRPADEYLEEQGYKSDDRSHTIRITCFVNVTVYHRPMATVCHTDEETRGSTS